MMRDLDQLRFTRRQDARRRRQFRGREGERVDETLSQRRHSLLTRLHLRRRHAEPCRDRIDHRVVEKGPPQRARDQLGDLRPAGAEHAGDGDDRHRCLR
jgi:hypothetical protein